MNLKASLLNPDKSRKVLLPLNTVKEDNARNHSKLVVVISMFVMLITSFTIFSG